MTDLNDMLDASGAGYEIASASAINNSGAIAATTINDRALMLTPLAGISTSLEIDPARSYLTLAADIEGILPLQEQLPGSLTAALQGMLGVDQGS
jgi:hypothetical protein